MKVEYTQLKISSIEEVLMSIEQVTAHNRYIPVKEEKADKHR